MFRRRPHRRRIIRRRKPRLSGSARTIYEIRQAHHLLESGEYQQANHEFIRLAQIARKHTQPQAPVLLLKAAKARVELGHADSAYYTIIQALDWLQEAERWGMLNRLGNRATSSLERAGFINEAGKIRKYIDEALDGVDLSTFSGGPTPMIGNCPEKCPYCGGTLDPDATELKSDRSLTCSYCGSRINPE